MWEKTTQRLSQSKISSKIWSATTMWTVITHVGGHWASLNITINIRKSLNTYFNVFIYLFKLGQIHIFLCRQRFFFCLSLIHLPYWCCYHGHFVSRSTWSIFTTLFCLALFSRWQSACFTVVDAFLKVLSISRSHGCHACTMLALTLFFRRLPLVPKMPRVLFVLVQKIHSLCSHPMSLKVSKKSWLMKTG